MRPRRMHSNPLLPVNSKQLKGRPNPANAFLRLVFLAAVLLIASYAFVTYRRSSSPKQTSRPEASTSGASQHSHDSRDSAYLGSAADHHYEGGSQKQELDSSPSSVHSVRHDANENPTLQAEHYPDATHQLSMKDHHLKQHKEPDVNTKGVRVDEPSSKTTTPGEAEHHSTAEIHEVVTAPETPPHTETHQADSHEVQVVHHHETVTAVHDQVGQDTHGAAGEHQEEATSLYDLSAEDIDGHVRPLKEFAGKVALVVNVASACGYTDENYKGLERLYQRYHSRGFTVLGFPCNQFGHQESGTLVEIKHFCTSRYHVTFPMFAKVDVLGEGSHPVYRFLKTHLPTSERGAEDLGPEGKKLVWNFNKFLVDQQGKPVRFFYQRFDQKELEDAIESMLTDPEALPL